MQELLQKAAEACKHFRHADRVTAAILSTCCGNSRSLTSYSLKVLRSKASRISAMSHMTFSKSLNNLLRQLSVKLWLHNEC